MYKIEKGIPFQPKRFKSEVGSLIAQMEIGDSAEILLSDRATAWVYAKRIGMKLKSSKTGMGLCRVWRIA